MPGIGRPLLMIIRTLRREDTERLLQFELSNRAWFEQHVLPRAQATYSLDGIARHIDEYLADYARGVLHPCLIVDQHGAIAGRANLKQIDGIAGSAEIGYRIGQSYIGQGCASRAVAALTVLAYGEWGLQSVDAYVAVQNRASARVLEKCGFTRSGRAAHPALIQNLLLDCSHFSHHKPG